MKRVSSALAYCYMCVLRLSELSHQMTLRSKFLKALTSGKCASFKKYTVDKKCLSHEQKTTKQKVL